MSLNHAGCEMHWIQRYMIKCVSYLRQIGGFLRIPSPIKLSAPIDIADIMLKVALNTTSLTLSIKFLFVILQLRINTKKLHKFSFSSSNSPKGPPAIRNYYSNLILNLFNEYSITLSYLIFNLI